MFRDNQGIQGNRGQPVRGQAPQGQPQGQPQQQQQQMDPKVQQLVNRFMSMDKQQIAVMLAQAILRIQQAEQQQAGGQPGGTQPPRNPR